MKPSPVPRELGRLLLFVYLHALVPIQIVDAPLTHARHHTFACSVLPTGIDGWILCRTYYHDPMGRLGGTECNGLASLFLSNIPWGHALPVKRVWGKTWGSIVFDSNSHRLPASGDSCLSSSSTSSSSSLFFLSVVLPDQATADTPIAEAVSSP